MASFKFGKFSGRSKGAGHGSKGRKCEKADSKDAVKWKESECTRKRGSWRSRCMKVLVADASINLASSTNLRSRVKPASHHHSSPKAELSKQTKSCEKSTEGEYKQELCSRNPGSDSLRHMTCIKDGSESIGSHALHSKEGVGCTECLGHSKVSSVEHGYEQFVWQDARCGEKRESIDACTDSDVCKRAEYEGLEEDDLCKAASLHSLGSKDIRFDARLYTKMMGEGDSSLCDERPTDNGVMQSLLTVPCDFVCGMSNRVMEDPAVVASGQTFERASIQAWLDEGNIECSLGLTVTQSSFTSCKSSFSSCPSSMTANQHEFVSCSSFSVSRLLEGMDLHNFSSGSWSSLPEPLMDLEVDSFSSSSTREGSRHGQNLSPASHSSRSSLCWEHKQPTSPEIKVSECMQADHQSTLSARRSKKLSRHSMSNELRSLSRRPSDYMMSRIDSLVCDLQSDLFDIQRNAAAELRLLAKHDNGNRLLIASAGAVKQLINLLWSADECIQLEATTALLNLSLNQALKEYIVEAGGSEALVGILRDGLSATVKENAAVALAHLAGREANRDRIGAVGAVVPLVDLLESGSLRGKKDAAAALYRLSSLDENKRRMVSAGALKLLVGFMSDGGEKEAMADKAMAILRNLVGIEEGRVAFVEEGGIMSLLQVIEVGSQRSRCLAVPILLQLCIHSSKHRSLVLKREPLPTLMSISKTAKSRLKSQVAEMIEVLIVDA